MDHETENVRLEERYRALLKRYYNSVAFWRTNPKVFSVEEIQELDVNATPGRTCSEAMDALDEWRAFRTAHGLA